MKRLRGDTREDRMQKMVNNALDSKANKVLEKLHHNQKKYRLHDLSSDLEIPGKGMW